jgi:hypothetical protein
VVEMARYFEPALFAVCSVADAETPLHPRLPRPGIDGVLAPHMTSAARGRAGRLTTISIGSAWSLNIHNSVWVLHVVGRSILHERCRMGAMVGDIMLF